MPVTYEQAFRDHSYLWETYGPAEDMTGGYIDQDDLRRLLRSPTKATARTCLVNQIVHWFSVGPEKYGNKTVERDDPTLLEIAERYGEEDALSRLG